VDAVPVLGTGVAVGVVSLVLLAAGHCDRASLICWPCPLVLPIECLASWTQSAPLYLIVFVGFFLQWPAIGFYFDRRRARSRRS
jgi:hypothetical protein